MIACTRKAVSAAEPSVCIQLMSDGTLRKRKYLTPPMSPDRSSSQSIGNMTSSSIFWRRISAFVGFRL